LTELTEYHQTAFLSAEYSTLETRKNRREPGLVNTAGGAALLRFFLPKTGTQHSNALARCHAKRTIQSLR